MPKIMIVEDEKQLVEYIKPSLEKRGFTVITVFNGQDALVSYPKENPEVVLLDLGLPDVNGRDILKDIKSKMPRIKVIVLSGYSDQETKNEVIALGADYFLNKPVIPTKLYGVIEEVLKK